MTKSREKEIIGDPQKKLPQELNPSFNALAQIQPSSSTSPQAMHHTPALSIHTECLPAGAVCRQLSFHSVHISVPVASHALAHLCVAHTICVHKHMTSNPCTLLFMTPSRDEPDPGPSQHFIAQASVIAQASSQPTISRQCHRCALIRTVYFHADPKHTASLSRPGSPRPRHRLTVSKSAFSH